VPLETVRDASIGGIRTRVDELRNHLVVVVIVTISVIAVITGIVRVAVALACAERSDQQHYPPPST
jgi:hypothetical protein